MEFSSTTSEACAGVLKALGDPTRLRIVELLGEGPAHVNDIATALGVPHYQASRHVSALVELGVVVRERHGRRVMCSLSATMPVIELGCCSVRLGPTA